MEYRILDKEESAEMKLTEGYQIQVHISHTSGNVDVIVGENGEELIYKGTEQEKADFILTIPKTGFYHISVTGHRAKGEISFTCIPLKEECRRMANTITFFRMAAGIVLLLCPVFSPAFYVFYIAACWMDSWREKQIPSASLGPGWIRWRTLCLWSYA